MTGEGNCKLTWENKNGIMCWRNSSSGQWHFVDRYTGMFRMTLTPPYCHTRNALNLYASLQGVISRTNGFFTVSTAKISNLTVVQLHLCCQHHTKQADGTTRIALLVLKLHTKSTFGQFRNPAALPPEKELPVRPEQDAAWAPQPVLTLVDKNL